MRAAWPIALAFVTALLIGWIIGRGGCCTLAPDLRQAFRVVQP